jgi:hypothetical protein
VRFRASMHFVSKLPVWVQSLSVLGGNVINQMQISGIPIYAVLYILFTTTAMNNVQFNLEEQTNYLY